MGSSQASVYHNIKAIYKVAATPFIFSHDYETVNTDSLQALGELLYDIK
jgi:hypothetical protein